MAGVVAAQGAQEGLRSFISALFGTLPGACEYDLSTPDCLKCFTYAKLFPLLFFATIFFFIFYVIIGQIGLKGAERQEALQQVLTTARERVGPTERKVAAILGVILALFFIHSEQLSGVHQLRIWTSVLIFIFIVIIVRSVVGVAFGVSIIAIIVLAIILLPLWHHIFATTFEEILLECV
jgi:hypothetical protein